MSPTPHSPEAGGLPNPNQAVTAQQLPEAAEKHATREAMQAVMAAGYGGMQVWHVEAIVERAIRAFLSKATGPDLLSLAAERMGDEEREALLGAISRALMNAPILRQHDGVSCHKVARHVLAALIPGEET